MEKMHTAEDDDDIVQWLLKLGWATDINGLLLLLNLSHEAPRSPEAPSPPVESSVTRAIQPIGGYVWQLLHSK